MRSRESSWRRRAVGPGPSPRALLAMLAACAAGCGVTRAPRPAFADDLAFLREHAEVVVLGGEDGGPRVAVVPRFQGRVMTSTVGDPRWPDGHGWLNRELIASGALVPHINAFGGEDRLWLGPEGGQFAIFFPPGAPFDLENWQTPAPIDSEPWTVAAQDAFSVSFRHDAVLENRAGRRFQVRIDRIVRLLDKPRVEECLGMALPRGVGLVAFESDNVLVNAGDEAWTKGGGLLSLWNLGMFPASPAALAVLPLRADDAGGRGPLVNDAYFGKVPEERLRVRDATLFFRGDGLHRSKIGVAPERARDVLGSYDASRDLLTIVQFTLPEGARDYVNSMWELQEDPYAGDVVNSYNDGGAGGAPTFFELETSSPAAALAPGESLRHVHRTIHLRGKPIDLDPLCRRILGAPLESCRP